MKEHICGGSGLFASVSYTSASQSLPALISIAGTGLFPQIQQ
jgi:hypothetical protein